MKKFLILTLGVTLVLAGCKKNNTSATKDEESATAKTTKPVNEPVIVFEKTPCFGTCPIYKVEIFENGMMNYNGKRFVKLIGEYKLSIGEEWVKNTLKEAEVIGFFEMEDKYDGSVTDLPSTHTTITSKKGTKRITARYEIPDNLKNLNRRIHNDIMNIIDKNAETIKQNTELRENRKKMVQPRPIKSLDVK